MAVIRGRSRDKRLTGEHAAFMPLATALLHDVERGRGVVALFTSSHHGEGVTHVTHGLAGALGGHWRVLIVDAQDRPAAEPPAACTVRTLGELREDGIRLRGAGVARALDTLRGQWDVTLIDAPPAALDPLAAAVAAHADRVYIVGRAGMTRPAPLQQTVAMLGASRVSGVILNDVRGLAPAWLRRMTA